MHQNLAYETGAIKKVEQSGDYYTITQENGWCLGLDKSYGVIPKVGDFIETYGSIGRPIQGVCINGKTLWFKGEKQLEEEHKAWCLNYQKEKEEAFLKSKESLDSSYMFLPEVFKKRIDRFRENNPKFRVDYEAYEMSCCIDAVKIAEAMKTPKRVNDFRKMDWEMQNTLVPNLYEGHSGNSFGCAVNLAYLYLKEPESVYKMHGSLSPLVGSQDFGDVKREETKGSVQQNF